MEMGDIIKDSNGNRYVIATSFDYDYTDTEYMSDFALIESKGNKATHKDKLTMVPAQVWKAKAVKLVEEFERFYTVLVYVADNERGELNDLPETTEDAKDCNINAEDVYLFDNAKQEEKTGLSLKGIIGV